MKAYIHARLRADDRAILDELRRVTGEGESALVRQGLRLVLKDVSRRPSALDLAGASVGRFRNGPRDLARNKKHLEGFGR